MLVTVRNNNVDRAMRILKKKMVDEGIFRELQERRFYEKPGEKRRRKLRAAVARQNKRLRETQEV